MSVFLDTSVLIKLYFPEADSEPTRVRVRAVNGVAYLSALSKVEYVSAAEKKVRTGEISPEFAQIALRMFEADVARYRFIALSEPVLQDAKRLVSQYATAGLRALDAIQLACAWQVRTEATLFLTADARLEAIFKQEGLPVQ